METRIDLESITYAANIYNTKSRRKGPFTGILPPSEIEDYGIDTSATGYTGNGVYDRIPVEFKTITDRFGPVTADGEEYGDFYHDKALRISRNIRWEDEWDDTGQPLHFINWYKYDKLMESRGALIFITEHGLIVFNHRALKKALVGKVDVWARLTTEFSGEWGWEAKAALDLSKNSEFIRHEFPRRFWHDQHGDS